MKLFGRDAKRDRNTVKPAPTVMDRLKESVECLPWFGEEPFLPSKEKRPPLRVQSDIPYLRRIMVSWLIGRPVSQVARRAGCSPRLVHKVINGYFYGEPETLNWHFEQWFELGLIAAIDTPGPAPGGEDEERWPDWLNPEHVTIACLVCHRLIERLPYEALSGDGSWMRDPAPLLDALWFLDRSEQRLGGLIQGHLMCHFALDYNPIRRLRSPVQRRLLLMKSALGNATPSERRSLAAMTGTLKRQNYRTTTPWATGVLDDFLAGESGPLLPVRNDRQIGLEQARRFWSGMI